MNQRCLGLGVALFFCLPAGWIALAQPEALLGEPPVWPTDISRLPRGPVTRSVTGGFTVNTASREEVRSFYNAVYLASDGVPMDTTAVVANCTPGTNSTAYREAVLRRINWFRAMAGIPASVTLDPTNSVQDQQAAVMFSRNGALSHTPPPSWSCFTTTGSNAAANSNIAWGNAGPDAITAYIWDAYANNVVVGHRRWILYPQTQVMGTGDVPEQGGFNSANATWVFDGHINDPRPTTRTRFVSWPPAGYAPYQVVFPRWSFSFPSADFTNAAVAMLSNGLPVSVQLETVANGYGENTLVWVPAGLDANSGTTRWPFSGADTVYSVTVSNVRFGANPSNFTYTVTVFDPALPGADHYPPVIAGTNLPAVGGSNSYTFTAVSNATSYQWRQALRFPFNFFDGAETGLGNFVVAADTNLYSLITNDLAASGSSSFHLAHPNPADQTLTLSRSIYVRTNTLLQFRSCLGYATPDELALVQLSPDNGLTWTNVYAQPGSDPNPPETVFSLRSVSLSNLAGANVTLRFNFEFQGGGYYPYSDYGVGWYIDNILVTNAEQLQAAVISPTAVTNFVFTPAQAGNYNLDVRALIFNEFPLDWGPVKLVSATNFPFLRIAGIAPISPGRFQIDFNATNISPTACQLFRANPVTAAFNLDPNAVLGTNPGGASYKFTTTNGGSPRWFYRVTAP
jgi:hypothetical protein